MFRNKLFTHASTGVVCAGAAVFGHKHGPSWFQEGVNTIDLFITGPKRCMDWSKFLIGKSDVVCKTVESGNCIFAVGSIQGMRKHMEDEWIATSIDATTDLFAVADGHSGGSASIYVRERLPDIFVRERVCSRDEKSMQEMFTDAVLETDKEFLEKARRNAMLDATTVCGVIVYKDEDEARTRVLCGNVGDSRAIVTGMLDTNLAIPLSDDHTGANPKEKQRLESVGGCIRHNHRLNGGRIPSRVIGAFHDKNPLHPPERWIASPFPEYHEVKINHGDESNIRIVIGSDGLWNEVSSDDAARIAWKHKDDPKSAVEELINTALKNGSTDNITAMVVAIRR